MERRKSTIDIYNYLGLPTLSSKVVIRLRFVAALSAIGKLRPMFHSMAPDALNASENQTSKIKHQIKHRQMFRAALGIDWRNNITNEENYANSGLLPFSQTIRKRILRLIGHLLRLQIRSATPLGLILKNLNVA